MKTRRNTRKIGAKAEDLAAEKLISEGYRIIRRNYFSRYGEIDIIAQDGGDIAFIEVKYRSSAKFGSPAEAVTYTKRSRIIKTAMCYLMENETEDFSIRFDVVEVYGDLSINLLKGAFIEE